MKKRKAPIVLFSILVVMVGSIFLYNSIAEGNASSGGEDRPAEAKGNEKATGNKSNVASKQDFRKDVMSRFSKEEKGNRSRNQIASESGNDPQIGAARAKDPDAQSPMILISKESTASAPKSPYPAPPKKVDQDRVASSQGQWFRR